MTRPRNRRAPRPRAPVVLVFGEDANDREALGELVRALAPHAPRCQSIREPIVLVRDRDAAGQRKNAADIATVVRAYANSHDVRLLVAHQDCDDIEPAHEPLALAIEGRLAACGVPVVAATPAWEMEAWWYQWPSAVLAVNRSWRNPNRAGTNVGLLRDAKEQLRRDLRPRGQATPRDYTESDAPVIAEKVRELGIVDQRGVQSASFARFADRVRASLPATP